MYSKIFLIVTKDRKEKENDKGENVQDTLMDL